MILFNDYRSLGLAFDPASLQVRPDNMEAFGITDAALGKDFYGQIIEAGNHQDLLAKGGLYSQSWMAQVESAPQVSEIQATRLVNS